MTGIRRGNQHICGRKQSSAHTSRESTVNEGKKYLRIYPSVKRSSAKNIADIISST